MLHHMFSMLPKLLGLSGQAFGAFLGPSDVALILRLRLTGLSAKMLHFPGNFHSHVGILLNRMHHVLRLVLLFRSQLMVFFLHGLGHLFRQLLDLLRQFLQVLRSHVSVAGFWEFVQLLVELREHGVLLVFKVFHGFMLDLPSDVVRLIRLAGRLFDALQPLLQLLQRFISIFQGLCVLMFCLLQSHLWGHCGGLCRQLRNEGRDEHGSHGEGLVEGRS
mmetsp:Transcript_60374/g.132228  ORF Transcript_60374/g.132228 Transcript_60374/m.132228 type:complete len:219 (-) Transcript_60374:57-713(-)